MIEYKIYSNNERDLWNNFVDNAKDSTIFQSQIFLAYHLQRNFSNHSLMFYKNKTLIGIFTGSSMTNANGEKILFSHPGASFGGIIQNTSSLSDTLEMIDLIEQYAVKNNFNQISIVPTPSIYFQNHHDTLMYGLKLKHFVEIERYYSSIIPIDTNVNNQMKAINRKKGRAINYYDTVIKENNLKIYWDKNFDSFYPILLDNKKMYNATPTHSLDELKKINELMPNNIHLLVVEKDGEIIGGNLILVANKQIAIIFYNMINYQFSDLQIAIIQVCESIKWAHKNKFKYLDFGVSHETGDEKFLIPKMSLIKFKEEFGAFGSTRTVLNKKIVE